MLIVQSIFFPFCKYLVFWYIIWVHLNAVKENYINNGAANMLFHFLFLFRVENLIFNAIVILFEVL